MSSPPEVPSMQARSAQRPKSWFFYRHPNERRFQLRVVALPNDSALGWFERLLRSGPEERRSYEDIQTELGGRVYGLWSLAERGEALPEVCAEAIQESIDDYCNDIEAVRATADSVRVLTDDDDHQLAYVFVDDEVVRAQPERFALPMLVHRNEELPSDVANAASFEPRMSLRKMLPGGQAEGTTYVLCLPTTSTCWFETMVVGIVPGVRLSQLGRCLREAPPVPEWSFAGGGTGWPDALLALRALVRPDEEGIDLALRRLARVPGGSAVPAGRLRAQTHADARKTLEAAMLDFTPEAADTIRALMHGERDPSFSTPLRNVRLELTPHAALLEDPDMLAFVLFDDLWATQHPELAHSLLAWSTHWDPLDGA